MASDFEILGMPPSADISAIKDAFRRRVKEVHPDHSSEEDSFKNHLLFIKINQAYRRIIASLPEIKEGRKPALRPRRANPPPARTIRETRDGAGLAPGIVLHKDPAYAFYRTAVKFFERIHPAKWSLDSGRQLKRPVTAEDAKDQEEMRNIVRDLVRLFPKAYYYFSIVVNEYPESPWSADAADKMRLIEERTRLYRKILDSFGVWDRSGPYKVFKPLEGSE